MQLTMYFETSEASGQVFMLTQRRPVLHLVEHKAIESLHRDCPSSVDLRDLKLTLDSVTGVSRLIWFLNSH